MDNEVKIEKWNVDKLIPYENNVKVHDEAQVKKIAESIKKFGWRGNPIIVDKNGVIIAGHGRRLAAIHLGLKKVPVSVETEMSPDEIKAYRLADNRVALSGTDTDMLKLELESFEYEDLLGGVFDSKELDFMSADLGMMNFDALITDLGGAVKEQQNETDDKVANASSKNVSIAKAIGFNNIQGKDQIYVTKFMAEIEHSTGKTGADAFCSFVRSFVEGDQS